MRSLLATLSTLAFATPLLAQRVAEVEPNNTAATAQAVALGVQIDANLTAGELDYYAFTTVADGEMRFSTSGSTDTRIEVTDTAGSVLFAGNDDARGLQSDITINLPAGSYCIRAFGYTATTAGAYSLDISRTALLKSYTDFENEPNDTVATANLLIGAFINNAQVAGNLSSAADVDVYQIILAAPKSALYVQVGEGDAPWISGHRLEFWDAAGVLLPAATLGVNAIDSGIFNSRSNAQRVWPAGTYHVVVRGRSAAPTYNPIPLGAYRLEIAVMPIGTGATVPEAAEPNNTIATATPLAPGDVGLGSLTNSTGADPTDLWGPFVAGGNGSLLTFQTTGVAVGGMLDTTLRLWQVAYPATVPPTLVAPPAGTISPATVTWTTGNILETATGSSHARGTVTFFVPGLVYYVEVVSPGTTAAMAGSYTIELSTNEPPLFVTSSYTIVAANATCGAAPRPTLTRQFTNETPTVGQTFVRQATNLDGVAGLLVLGLESVLPIDIVGLGFSLAPAGSCFLNVSPDLVNVITNGDIVFNVPKSVSLRGAYVWEQVVDVASISPVDLQMGNYARILIGERSW